jgi:hypothetical protein
MYPGVSFFFSLLHSFYNGGNPKLISCVFQDQCKSGTPLVEFASEDEE